MAGHYGQLITVSDTPVAIPHGFVGGVRFDPSTAWPGASANITSGVATIDAGGIHIYNRKWSYIRGPGQLTSNQSFLDIFAHVENLAPDNNGDKVHHGLIIESVISGTMGLRMSGNHEGPAVVYLQGSQSNAFTGNIEISGRGNYLALGKKNGAIAVQGDVLVKNSAVLRFDESNQLRSTSNVTLSYATLYHSTVERELRNQFHRLKVTGGLGVVSFGSKGTHTAKRYLFLDELVIEGKARIEVNEWAPGRDFLLVKKTMDKKVLDALMNKIQFRGWLPGRTHLESYDEGYWEISGTPEPTAYGAILGAVALALAGWRLRRRCGQ